MAKKAKKLLKKIAKYGAVFAAGAILSLSTYVFIVQEPSIIDVPVLSCRVDTGAKILSGADIAERYATAMIYLNEQPYIFKQTRGVDILTGLAEDGWVPAMTMLWRHHVNKAEDTLWYPKRATEHLRKSLHWARQAAAHGSPYALGLNISMFDALGYITDADIALLESYKDVHPVASYGLSNYYQRAKAPKQSDKKAAYWHHYNQTHTFPYGTGEWRNSDLPIIKQKDYLFPVE